MKSNMRGTVCGLSLVFLLTGCVQHLPVTSPAVNVKFVRGVPGAGMLGFEPTHVRVFQKADKGSVEIAGAECRIQGSGFSARLLSPAIVNLPDYGLKSLPVTATCTYGEQTATIIAKPYSATAESYRDYATSSAGLVGLLVAETAMSFDKEKKNHDFKYRPIHVKLPK